MSAEQLIGRLASLLQLPDDNIDSYLAVLTAPPTATAISPAEARQRLEAQSETSSACRQAIESIMASCEDTAHASRFLVLLTHIAEDKVLRTMLSVRMAAKSNRPTFSSSVPSSASSFVSPPTSDPRTPPRSRPHTLPSEVPPPTRSTPTQHTTTAASTTSLPPDARPTSFLPPADIRLGSPARAAAAVLGSPARAAAAVSLFQSPPHVPANRSPNHHSGRLTPSALSFATTTTSHSPTSTAAAIPPPPQNPHPARTSPSRALFTTPTSTATTPLPHPSSSVYRSNNDNDNDDNNNKNNSNDNKKNRTNRSGLTPSATTTTTPTKTTVGYHQHDNNKTNNYSNNNHHHHRSATPPHPHSSSSLPSSSSSSSRANGASGSVGGDAAGLRSPPARALVAIARSPAAAVTVKLSVTAAPPSHLITLSGGLKHTTTTTNTTAGSGQGQGGGAVALWKSQSMPRFEFRARGEMAGERQSSAFGQQKKLLAHSAISNNPDTTVTPSSSSSPSVPSIGLLPPAAQEALLVDDLLSALMSFSGQYIVGSGDSWQIHPDVDPPLAELSSRVLSLAKNFSAIETFVDSMQQYECGVVAHALAAAIRALTQEYLMLVAQLEHQVRRGAVGLQKLVFFLQPAIFTLSTLRSLCDEIQTHGARGGRLLNIVHHRGRALAGNKNSQQLFHFLLERASAPYFTILKSWLYRGLVQDTYGEFFVAEDDTVTKENVECDYHDAYWQQHYTLQQDMFPEFLQYSNMSKILTTGKYLNVIRECGRNISNPSPQDIVFSRDRSYAEQVDTAFTFANTQLLELLFTEFRLVARLRTLKHFFLLDHGDFFVHFLDSCEEELSKRCSDISRSKLDSLLELSVRQSSIAHAPFRHNITCQLLPVSLQAQVERVITTKRQTQLAVDSAAAHAHATASPSQFKSASAPCTPSHKKGTRTQSLDPADIDPSLTGLNGFTFDSKVEWPVSLVISRKALTKYQMLFRLRLQCLVVERQLSHSWQMHQVTSQVGASRALFMRSHLLRQRMIHFLQNFIHYMANEVFEPNWQILESKLQSAKTVDDLLHHHNEFLNRCMKECLLTDNKLLKLLNKLFAVCANFASYNDSFCKTLATQDQRNSRSRRAHVAAPQSESQTSEALTKSICEQGYAKLVAQVEEIFSTSMVALLEEMRTYHSLTPDPYLANLSARFNFNGYYSLSR